MVRRQVQMSEVLSQNQIDNLIGSLMSGANVTEPEQKTDNLIKYDFTRPRKFTKDNQRVIKGIYDNYARLASLRLNSLLRSFCELGVLSVEEQRYFEFNNMVDENDAIVIARTQLSNDKEYPMLFHVSQNMVLAMGDRLLGAATISDDGLSSVHKYSDIEVSLYRRIMEATGVALEDSFNKYDEMKVREYQIETNPGLFQEIGLEEAVIIIVLSVKMDMSEGMMTICIPGKVIYKMLSEINVYQRVVDDEFNTDIDRVTIMESIKSSALEVRGVLNTVYLDVEDLSTLEVGDVIDLNMSPDSLVDVYIGQKPLLRGKGGVYKNNTAIEIDSYIME